MQIAEGMPPEGKLFTVGLLKAKLKKIDGLLTIRRAWIRATPVPVLWETLACTGRHGPFVLHRTHLASQVIPILADHSDESNCVVGIRNGGLHVDPSL